MSGYWSALSSPTGTVNLTISNYFPITNAYFFAPVITNTSGTDLEMAVNYGFANQNECNCVVSSGAGPTRIGYYKLYSNSNVAAFAASSNYTGGYRYNSNLFPSVAQGSGQINLTFSVFP
jgi:hypothetical protein